MKAVRLLLKLADDNQRNHEYIDAAALTAGGLGAAIGGGYWYHKNKQLYDKYLNEVNHYKDKINKLENEIKQLEEEENSLTDQRKHLMEQRTDKSNIKKIQSKIDSLQNQINETRMKIKNLHSKVGEVLDARLDAIINKKLHLLRSRVGLGAAGIGALGALGGMYKMLHSNNQQ
jgi:DNA repair exonuclease SbcCD ATPase subunit